ncbi:MAG: pilus assembly FimT family protein [Desulfovibrionales bacterium]
MMPTLRAGTWNKGYSLLELTVVIAILALMAGLLVPRFSAGLFAKDRKAGIRSLSAVLSQARNSAMLSGMPVSLVFPVGTEGETCLRLEQENPEDDEQELFFQGSVCLPDDVHIARVRTMDETVHTHGEVSLLFLPTGLAEPATFELTSSDGNDSISLLPFNARLRLNSRTDFSSRETGM